MSNPLNSPTPLKPSSPIPTRPMTPTNLWTPTKSRPLSPVFDEKILPSHWSSNTRQVIKKTMDNLLKLKKILELAIWSLKHSLPALHLPKEQMNELIKALMMAAEQFKNVQDSAHPFAKYLKKEDRYIIEALITSEPLTKSLTNYLPHQHIWSMCYTTRKTTTSEALDIT